MSGRELHTVSSHSKISENISIEVFFNVHGHLSGEQEKKRYLLHAQLAKGRCVEGRSTDLCRHTLFELQLFSFFLNPTNFRGSLTPGPPLR